MARAGADSPSESRGRTLRSQASHVPLYGFLYSGRLKPAADMYAAMGLQLALWLGLIVAVGFAGASALIQATAWQTRSPRTTRRGPG